MRKEVANEIIKALESNKEVTNVTIKDNTVDTKKEFTLDDYNNKELELTADYVCFRLKTNEKNTNEKIYRFHFESSKRIVLNIHYKDFVDRKTFNIKKSSIDYVMKDTDYKKALETIIAVHKKYIASVNKEKKESEKKVTTTATKKTEKNKEAK